MSDTESPKEILEEFHILTRRYRGATAEGLVAVLCPLLIPIKMLDKKIIRMTGQTHYRATFSVEITPETKSALVPGRTGKFVPHLYGSGTGAWVEIAKGRIIELDFAKNLAHGEVYTGGTRDRLDAALEILQPHDLFEVDQYGAAAKVLSGLAEYRLVEIAKEGGYEIRRMPEDMARHIGSYKNYDYELEKNGVTKKLEVKSLWGTNTDYARLIHSTTTRPPGDPSTWTPEAARNYYPTSSCKFSTQDIFAVSMFLRTGDIRDFAFARSVPRDVKPYGLPRAEAYPEHVNQNPSCQIGDGTWFATLEEVWDLE